MNAARALESGRWVTDRRLGKSCRWLCGARRIGPVLACDCEQSRIAALSERNHRTALIGEGKAMEPLFEAEHVDPYSRP
jgi:hypothetical protein